MKIIPTNILKSKIAHRIALMLSTSMILASCTIQTGAYSETDGVYYDPEKDILPENIRYESQVGETYVYEDQNKSIADGAFERKWERNHRYWDESSSDATSSDWGNYTGTETHIYDSGWMGYGGWGWYAPYRWGWGYPHIGYYGNYGWGWGMSLGWGWNSLYNPYWGFYDPFWGYSLGLYGGYRWGIPYYPYGYGYRSIPRSRSGAVNSFRNGGYSNYGNDRNSSTVGNQRHSGFINPNQNRGFQQNGGFRTNNNTRFQDNGNYAPRSGSFNNTPRRNNLNNSAPRQGGFNNTAPRSGGFNNSSSSGGFRSGGFNSGGGGFRSSGGRTGGFR